jgi:hypothetical protein
MEPEASCGLSSCFRLSSALTGDGLEMQVSMTPNQVLMASQSTLANGITQTCPWFDH